MQRNGCRSCKRAEKKTTGGSGHGRDQEVEQIVRAASLRGTVGELAVGGSGRKRRRKFVKERESEQRWLLVAGRWLCWLSMVELVAENLMVMTMVAGTVETRERVKTDGRKGKHSGEERWFSADFGPDFLPPQGMKSTYIYRQWKWAILSTLGKNISI